MPLYPYRCAQCGHLFEKIQKFGAKPEKVCPKCGGALERPLTAPGLKFKGGGWYVNDYAAKGGSSVSASAESAPAEKKAATQTKTESACGASCGGACAASSTAAGASSTSNN